ncbi:aldehyde dehydrogenase family protein [Bradyrhizobium sp. TZ2]
MANARRIEAMERLTKDAVDRGARIETGNCQIERYWAPTILSHVDPESRVLHEEPFGPILTVAPFSNRRGNKGGQRDRVWSCILYLRSPEIQKRMIRCLSAGALLSTTSRAYLGMRQMRASNRAAMVMKVGAEGVRAFPKSEPR